MLHGSARLKIDQAPVLPIVAATIDLQASSFLSLNPELEPADLPVLLEVPALPADSGLTELSIQSPIIDPEIRLDVSAYNARALLPPGSVAAVILLLEIGANGSVLSAQVVRSDTSESANEAAREYALATQWIPGRIDGVPQAMQASLTVILGERT